MATSTEILERLNNISVGSLERILERLERSRTDLELLGQDELAAKIGEARRALVSGDEAVFQKRVAHVVSKLGHLRARG